MTHTLLHTGSFEVLYFADFGCQYSILRLFQGEVLSDYGDVGVRLGVEVGVRYLLGTCWPNTYLLENPLYIEVLALLR